MTSHHMKAVVDYVVLSYGILIALPTSSQVALPFKRYLSSATFVPVYLHLRGEGTNCLTVRYHRHYFIHCNVRTFRTAGPDSAGLNGVGLNGR